MLEYRSKNRHDRGLILDSLMKILGEMSSGWEMEFQAPIGSDTLLGADLAFKSIDLARLVAAIQKLYSHQELPFQELFMPDDRPVQDLSVSDLVDFLYKDLNKL